MKTIVFIETNFSGLDAIRYCSENGYHSILITDNLARFKKWFPASCLYKLEMANEIITVNNSNDFEALRDILTKRVEKIDAILTFAEIRTAITARLCMHFDLRGTDPTAIEMAQDKYFFRKVMLEKGVDTVKAKRIESVDQLRSVKNSLSFPCFLKPTQGHSSIGAIACMKESDIEAVIAKLETVSEDWISSDYVIEDYLSGRLVSIEMLTVGPGDHLLVGISDRDVIQDSVEIGASFPLIDEHLEEIQTIARCALDAIGYNFGPSHIEIILSDTGPHLVELNSRVGGSGHNVMLDLSTERSIVGDCIELCLDNLPKTRPLYQPVQGAAWRCLVSDTIGTLASLPSIEAIKHSFSSVREVWFHHEIGSHIGVIDSNYSWIVQVMCVGRDQQEAKKNASQVINYISQRIVIEQKHKKSA
jgi:biotin carboxylase